MPEIPPALLEGLNPEQRKAVTTLDGAVLIVAGPGAGKTRALTHRIAALVATGVPPYRVLAVTFTNKAAREMRERLTSLVGEEAMGSMWVATFHSACVRMLRTHFEAAGLPRSFTIVDADDAKRLVKNACREEGLFEGLTPTEEKELVKEVASGISRAKNDGRSIEQLEAAGFQGPIIAQAWRAYQKKLADLGAVDFDDILLRAARLMESNPEVAAWAHRRFSHVLVDEYQDTNRIQELITRHWAAAGNLCVVGDPDQSIYAFRGAAPAVMTNFTKQYPDATVVVLDRNYRSTGNICAVSRALISANPAEHRAHTRTDAPSGPPVLIHSASESDAEAEWVASRIMERGPSWSEHAVLLRTIALSRALENSLRRRSIPYTIVGGTSFYDRAEIKDVLAWLRIALNPFDQIAFTRAAATPRRGLGSTTLQAIMELSARDGISCLDAAREIAVVVPRATKAINSFLDDVELVRESLLDGAEASVRTVLGPVGLRSHVATQSAKDGLDRLENLDALVEESRSFDTSSKIQDVEGRIVSTLDGPDRVLACVENAALTSDSLATAQADRGEVGADGLVQVMTIHAAKGKEFDSVYVMGLEENVLPHSRSLASGLDSDIEEERRLAFVAASRARKHLSLTCARMRFFFGDEVTNEPSRFLTDIPEEVVEHSTDAGMFTPGSRLPGARRGQRTDTVFTASRVTPGRPKQASRTPWSPGVTARPQPVSKSALALAVGDLVEHKTFGAGVVLSANGDYAEVDFAGSKKMLDTSRAPLRKL